MSENVMTTPASVDSRRDLESGWTLYTLRQGTTVVEVVPAAGCNARSITVDGTSYLRPAPSLRDLRGTKFGVPVLYPTPNRVRDSKMTFNGRDYYFTPNNGAHFLHGLVHSEAWDVELVRERVDRRGSSEPVSELEASFTFAPGKPWFDLFPHPHVLRLTIGVRAGSVRWTYTVDNSDGTTTVPFGFALHPWFLHLGPRNQTMLTVPATHWMEAFELIPTGRLVELSETPYDLGQPRPLENFFVDDVYFGVDASTPSVIDYQSVGKRIELSCSEDFTHMVVFTPSDREAFCVENQTCSTDAHNLHDRELTKASHLLQVSPGETHSGWIEYRFFPTASE